MGEATETSGVELLELYINFIGGAKYLDWDEKLVLRHCCKRLRSVVDSAITYASIRNNESLCSLLQRNWPLEYVSISDLENDSQKLSLEALKTFVDSADEKFPTLESLYLNASNIRELPESIGKIMSLTSINFCLPLQGLPTSISRLTKLETILFPDNCIDIKLKLQDMDILKNLNNLKRFHIELNKDESNSDQDVEDIVPQQLPDYVFSLTALTQLHFGATFPCSLPNALSNLK